MKTMCRIVMLTLMVLSFLHQSTSQQDNSGLNLLAQQNRNNSMSNGQVSNPQPSPVDDPLGTTTTTPSPAFRACNSACQSVQNYNPVCGSDGISYNNIYRLNCARKCGQKVQKVRGGTCASL